MKTPVRLAIVTGLALLTADTGVAALFDRGGGLIYDNVLDVTWLQDANYAKTLGIAPNGLTWQEAVAWVSSLAYYDSVRDVVLDDWRLPMLTPINGNDFCYRFLYDGNCDYGYNVKSTKSELAYMFHQNLGLKSAYTPDSEGRPAGSFGVTNANIEVPGGDGKSIEIFHLESNFYWTAIEYDRPQGGAWVFSFSSGYQGPIGRNNPLVPWPVMNGDVAAIPEPSTLSLFIAGGLLALIAGQPLTRMKAKGTPNTGGAPPSSMWTSSRPTPQ